MKCGFYIAAAILVWTSAQAVEPKPAPSAVATSSSVPAPAAPASGPEQLPKRLDLRVGDIRKYMTPEEFQALLTPPDEANTVVVTGTVLLPMKSELDVPTGIMAPFWALANPHRAWRLFLPDPRIDITKIPPPESKIPPPIFRWGP